MYFMTMRKGGVGRGLLALAKMPEANVYGTDLMSDRDHYTTSKIVRLYV